MAVERLTDYTRRIWTALDADAPEGHDFQVNDVIYYMDSSQCGIVTQVYPGGSIDVEFLPDIGGGGGGDAVMGTTITTGSQVVIPKVPGYDNFIAYVNGNQDYITQNTGRHIVSYRIRWCFGTRIAETKANTNWLPTLTYGTMLASKIAETDDMITQTYDNGNTIGSMVAGMEIVYIWF